MLVGGMNSNKGVASNRAIQLPVNSELSAVLAAASNRASISLRTSLAKVKTAQGASQTADTVCG